MKVETQGFSGKVTKLAKVYTNDPKDKLQNISIQAMIRPLIEVTPPAIVLKGQAGQVVEQTVEIRSNSEKPLQLEPLFFDLENKVAYSLEEIQPGILYRVRLSNVPGLSGIVHGTLTLKTNYPERPELYIRVGCKFPE